MTTFVYPAAIGEAAKTVVFVRGEGQAVKSQINDAIRQLAYQKWEEAGRPETDGVSFWLEAEREFLQEECPVSSAV